MGIIAWIIFGGIAGWVASLIAGTDASQGIVMNIVVGVVGALIGGFIFGFFGNAGITGFNLYSLVVAVMGSVVLLMVASVLRS